MCAKTCFISSIMLDSIKSVYYEKSLKTSFNLTVEKIVLGWGRSRKNSIKFCTNRVVLDLEMKRWRYNTPKSKYKIIRNVFFDAFTFLR